MPSKIIAPVHPPTLRRIRELVGYAKRNKVDIKLPGITDVAKQIRRWEKGESINLFQARKLAQKYRVELPVLYLERPPSFLKQPWSLSDFRRKKQGQSFSPDLRFAFRETYFQQNWLRDYLEEIGERKRVLPRKAKLNDEPNKIASVIREWLQVGDDPEANRPEKATQAFEEWKRVLDKHRVIVLTNRSGRGYSIAKEEYEGLALADKVAPVILLNPIISIPPRRRIFTLMHELAHLFLGDKAVSTIDFYGGYASGRSRKSRKEIWCNKVAGNVLVPSQWLEHRWIDGGNSERQIKALARKIHVSREVLAIRAQEIGKIKKAELNSLFQAYKSKGHRGQEQKTSRTTQLLLDAPSEGEERHKKKHERSHTASSRSSRQDTNINAALQRCGHYFSRCVLDAYQRDIIDVTEIYDLTGGLKLKYLKEFAAKIGYPLHRWK